MTRNVPCFRRAAAAEGESEAPESLVEGARARGAGNHPRSASLRLTRLSPEGGIGSTPDDSGWLAPGLPGGGVEVVDEAESVSAPSDAGSTQSSLSTFARRAAELATEPAEAVVENPAGEEEAVLEDAATDDRPVPDISDWAQQDALATQLGASKLETGSGGGGGGGGGEGEDAASLPYMTAREPEDPILRTRTYDVSITYDRYYQTPRIWLAGFDERRAPLPPAAALADVSSEHARKTVTIDGHPHTGAAAVSIHPCKHGAVMKRLADTMAEGGVAPRDEHYLLLFLRLVQTAIPTVEYDFSVQM